MSYQTRVKIEDCIRVTSSQIAANIFRPFIQPHVEYQEIFLIMLLNRANYCKGIVEISKGGISGTVVDKRLVYAIALKTLSVSVIGCHNHPSGNVSASKADLALTKDLVSVGKLLNIGFLDNLILTKDSYLSFADEGLL